MAEYFECLGCCAVTVVSVTSSQVINVTLWCAEIRVACNLNGGNRCAWRIVA